MLRPVEILVRTRRPVLALAVSFLAAYALAQEPSKAYQPQVGQAGKDVVWVPMPEEQIEKMLDLGKVTRSAAPSPATPSRTAGWRGRRFASARAARSIGYA